MAAATARAKPIAQPTLGMRAAINSEESGGVSTLNKTGAARFIT